MGADLDVGVGLPHKEHKSKVFLVVVFKCQTNSWMMWKETFMKPQYKEVSAIMSKNSHPISSSLDSFVE